jgi:hypothetical protein
MEKAHSFKFWADMFHVDGSRKKISNCLERDEMGDRELDPDEITEIASGDRELNPDEIDAVLKKSSRKGHSFTLPGTNRKMKYDPNVRTVYNWFKLPHTVNGPCEVPNHNETRESREAPRMFYVHDNGMKTCRWCFVEARDLT